mgnify:FL=1
MTFKAEWEKANDSHILAANVVENMAAIACPGKNLISQEMISGGCANLNIKIQLEGDLEPLLLRVYLRDKDAAWREKSIATLLQSTVRVPVPVPQVLRICDYENYRFAITEFIPGITLRDLLLSDEPHDVGTVMRQVGTILARIAAHKFPAAGFFDKNLHVINQLIPDDYLKHAKQSLQNNIVSIQLGADAIAKINVTLDKYAHLFPSGKEKQLVHADFDPANILVAKIENDWQITGILDWEFSFSGSALYDIANMLRYKHQTSAIFEQAFLNGLTQSGINLPENWTIIVDILNLVSLLDCLTRSDPEKMPKRCADINLLSYNIIQRLSQE